jgi:mannose-6-phosphate isomerase-like protein (cupin superfamily)
MEWPMLKVVEKLWGREEWIVNNELYCAKRLIVDPGFSCSLHSHNIKDETFVIQDGILLSGARRQTVHNDSRRRPAHISRTEASLLDPQESILVRCHTGSIDSSQ